MQTAADIPLLVTSDNSSSERRITPSWSIGQLKSKLEAVTGIPPSYQKITLRVNQQGIPVEAADEENTQLAAFPLAPYAELHVSTLILRFSRDRIPLLYSIRSTILGLICMGQKGVHLRVIESMFHQASQ